MGTREKKYIPENISNCKFHEYITTIIGCLFVHSSYFLLLKNVKECQIFKMNPPQKSTQKIYYESPSLIVKKMHSFPLVANSFDPILRTNFTG